MSEKLQAGGLHLDRIIFIGRTYNEYMSMFDLTEEQLQGRRILDCPAGACSFTAEASKHGLDVIATDIAYTFDTDALHAKGKQDIAHMLEHMQTAHHEYDWTMMGTIEQLGNTRLFALETFCKDRAQYDQRYIPATLPQLPLPDKSVDLTLSAHFLFMYADRLDLSFHIQCLREMMRVTTQEIRIFPLVNLQGERVSFIEEAIFTASAGEWISEEKPTPYIFQKGAESMLILKRKL
ncbi:SAM-dependent methyltransferase [Paenibacillus sp. KACC 21273]|uniref:class I SAM-dependent methyltransferase n=1 Tax=Paenibacillus sp. KACC 21273 TaxID=3025665 RepID=UPI002365B821|nr:SAM-dependent methyltransferase [Paenibacillus sp. KACC 21273]WDF52483.1 SAM-dependent methyltransferase [Paenibacillus sp. KACC 21273]